MSTMSASSKPRPASPRPGSPHLAPPAEPQDSLSSLQALAALGLTSGAVVSYEVLITRLLSVVTWYGMAFFVLSIAMLGLTAGSLHALRAQRAGVPMRQFVARHCLLLSSTIVLGVIVTLVVPMPADPTLTLQLAVLLV